MKRILMFIMPLVLVLALSLQVYGQESSRNVISRAMKDEIKRNMENLEIKDLKKPFFISYNLQDAKVMNIKASLGAIIMSKMEPVRDHNVRVMVGDYKRNDENFIDPGSRGGGRSPISQNTEKLPLEDDYFGIRRSLWSATDEVYKSATETYERKISAIEQQNLSEEEKNLPDFAEAPKVTKKLPKREFKFEPEKWEQTAKEVSAIFKNYPEIFTSSVKVNFYSADAFFVNSEGTEMIYPISIAGIRVNAHTQADDGEPLYDHVSYFGLTPADLPDKQKIMNEVKAMAENLKKLREAPALEQIYTGPILFEGQAAAELIAQKLFSNDGGLIAKRKPIYGDMRMMMFMERSAGKSLEDKIDMKVVSKEMSVTAKPKTKQYDGKSLIGSYEVDEEGVAPPDELVLIEGGMLKTLLNNRIPTKKKAASNGHQRYSINGSRVRQTVGPGVIEVDYEGGAKKADMKQALIDAAKEEGLQFAYIVRKVQYEAAGMDKKFDPSAMMSSMMGGQQKETFSKPIQIYRVDVATGEEQLVRGAELGDISVGSLKDLLNGSKEKYVYNTIYSGSGGGGGGMGGFYSILFGGSESMSGIPASFIVPESLLLEEADVKEEERAITAKLPVVENPVGGK